MNSTRIKLLQKFIEEEPYNPFNRYALGLEYLALDKKKAEALFDQLLTRHPDYLPTYYQAGLLKAELGNTSDSLRILHAGIDLAQKTGEFKALKELQQAFREIQEDD